MLKVENKNRITNIILNRAEKRNALNYEFVTELKKALLEAKNDENCKIVILKAEGKVFSAGADLEYLKQLQNNTFEENLADSTHLMELFKMIYEFPKIIIAQIQGHAIAGGCGLATICDFSFAVPEAKFAYTEVKIGFIPAIVMVFLVRKIGEGKAKELLFSGKLIEAQEAHQMGLINEIVSKENLENHVSEFAEQLCQNASGSSLELTKQMLAKVQDLPYEEALNYAAKQNAKARNTSDCKKGIAAFLNKEKLKF